MFIISLAFNFTGERAKRAAKENKQKCKIIKMRF